MRRRISMDYAPASRPAVGKARSMKDSVTSRLSRGSRLVGNTYASLAALVAALSFLIALAGLFGLLCLFFLRYHASEDADVVRTLTFDYSTPIAIASVSLMAPKTGSAGHLSLTWPLLWPFSRTPAKHEAQETFPEHPWSGMPPPPSPQQAKQWFGEKPSGSPPWKTLPPQHIASEQRAFQAGREVSVQVTLKLPVNYAELFQLTGELLTADSKVMARAVHTHLPKPEPPLFRILRSCFWFPLYFVGYYDCTHDVRFKLFDRYMEKQAMPITKARVYLKSRNTTIGSLPPPPVHAADLRVQQRLGYLRTFLSWVRPSWVTTVILGAVMSAVIGSASFITAGALGVALLLHRLSKATPPEPAKAIPPSSVQEGPMPLPALEPASPHSDREDFVFVKQHQGAHQRLPSSDLGDGEGQGGESEEGGSLRGEQSKPDSASSHSPEAGGERDEVQEGWQEGSHEQRGEQGAGAKAPRDVGD